MVTSVCYVVMLALVFLSFVILAVQPRYSPSHRYWTCDNSLPFSMDHRYNSLPFSIQNSNSYSLTSQTFMLKHSHMDPTPVMLWGRSPQPGRLRRGCHHRLLLDIGRHRLQVDTGRHHLQPTIQARVPALLLHLSARDIGHRRCEHLQLEGKPHHEECLCGRHRCRSHSDLLPHHRQ
jgi:hypothetical protein